MQRLDGNGNGKLDKDELAKLPSAMRDGLQSADVNQDGAIDRGELSAAMAKFRQRTRPRGPQPGAGP